MREFTSDRGFYFLLEPNYTEPHAETRLVSESSAIGDYEDSLDKPGSSFLWVGANHHLNREQVAELAAYLQNWLKTGRLFDATGNKTGADPARR